MHVLCGVKQMAKVEEIFGSMVFNDAAMKQRLPKETYKSLKKSVNENIPVPREVANVVANAMKDWAVEKGATHFTHWFQPMTGITAEKHDSFISPLDNGKAIMEFSGKELIKGEPDASSFPSGGLRATFEARGYTAWDPTSYAFIKENTLCIPTVFCSYGGEVLDKKTPLLRSMEVVNMQAMRILKLFGNEYAARVIPTVGPEQEYFLIDKELYAKRKDLRYTGRTLFGAKPPKGQELDDHYFGAIRPRVVKFMAELDEELWKLGILAKTEHNEVAPSQHELAPIFSDTNTGCDHNQLTMEMMKKVADRNGLVCLLHEKPFADVNGSGKHVNWSLATDTGLNLLDPGKTPSDNAQFLLFLCAIIKGVDEYQDMLRATVATAGNDHRLGANEAPPAVISIFVGSELMEILDSIESGRQYQGRKMGYMEVGVDMLPVFRKDTTDRNRTSPFAFTGNKFEFRMLGASQSIAGPCIALNTIMAEELEQFAAVLEKAEDFNAALNGLIRDTIRRHRRILFDGNGYESSWIEEAERRGLSNYRTVPDAMPHYVDEKNIALFSKHNVFTEVEMRSRCEVHLENYCKVIRIEALTMAEMVRKDIIPASYTYLKRLSETAVAVKTACPELDCAMEIKMLKHLRSYTDSLYMDLNSLESLLDSVPCGSELEKAVYYRDKILPVMHALRSGADEIEKFVGEKYWPYPTYGELLYSV